MFRLARTSLLVLAVVVVCNCVAKAQEPRLDPWGRWINDVTEPWFFENSHPKDEVLIVQKRWADLASESTRPNDQFQGDYFEGSDTHGDYLRWSKDGFVLFKVDKCRATVMAFSYGSVVSTPNLITLIPEKTVRGSEKHGHGAPSLNFLPVKFAKDLLLVPRNKIASFGDYVAGLGQYNDWLLNGVGAIFFLTKLDSQSDAANDTPIVPDGYQRFLKKPVDATVLSVGRAYVKRSIDNEWWDNLVTPVTLKLSRLGVKRGLKLRIIGSDELIEVTSVNRQSAQGKIVRSVRRKPCVKFDPDDDCSDNVYEAIKVGIKGSTRQNPAGS